MLTYAGDELNDIVDTLHPDQITPGDDETSFGKLKDAITHHFNPQSNSEFQKYTFRQLTQTSTINEFYGQLKQHANTCGFTDAVAEIKSQFIAGCKTTKVREKGLGNPNLTLDNLLQYAKTV